MVKLVSLIFVATGGKKEKDFAQTTSACLSFIQEALLKHQWQQAAEYMHSYLQVLEDSDSCKRQAAPEVSARLLQETVRSVSSCLLSSTGIASAASHVDSSKSYRK